MRKILTTWGMILLMLVSIVGTAAAQTGVDPTAVPTSQPAESTAYLHPIVQILSAYFGRMSRPMLPTPAPSETPTVDSSATPTEATSETPTETSTETVTETPTETPTVEPVMGPEEFAAQIAMYHQEGMGFGVLVKLYSMAEASVEACLEQMPANGAVDPTQPACEALTVDQLVSEFQGGTGMGQLFKEYGKPALLGVGHVKKALQNLPPATPTPEPNAVVTSTPEPTTSMDSSSAQSQNQKSNNGKGQGNKPVKVKTPKPKGPKK